MADEPVVEEPEVPERPGWLPEKYQNEDEFRKGFDELQANWTRDRQELSEIRSTLDAVLEAQQATEQPQETPFDQDQWMAAFEQNPLGVMALVANQAADQRLAEYQKQQQEAQKPLVETQNELLAFTAEQLIANDPQIEAWDEYKPKVAEMIQAQPWLLPKEALASPQQTAAALKVAYKTVRYEEMQQNPKETLAQQAEQNRIAKLQAQTTPGSAGRPEASQDVSDDEFFAQLKAAHSGTYAANMGAKGL